MLYGYLNENFQREYNNILQMFSCGKKSRNRPLSSQPLRPIASEPLQPRQPCIGPLVKVFQTVMFLEQKNAAAADAMSTTSSTSCITCKNCSLCNADDVISCRMTDHVVDPFPDLSVKCDKNIQCDQFSIVLTNGRTKLIENQKLGKIYSSKSLPCLL